MTKSIDGSIYEPKIDDDMCIHCSNCFKVCPGHSLNFKEYNQILFNKLPSNILMGNFINCYIGYSTDENIRYNSTSGGIATQILIHLIDNDLIDGALVTRMNKNKPLEPEPFIAKTKEEIVSSAVSKYCPVPLNKSIKELMGKPGKFAVVGLPCHIHGIRKLEKLNEDIRKKIILHIGLLCSHGVNFNGTQFILKKNNIKENDVEEISYRGHGWPGRMTIKMKNGVNRVIPFNRNWNAYWSIFMPYFFTPERCMMCTDLMAELADISLGDAWLPEFMNDKVGLSLIISRSDTSKNILKKMINDKLIKLKRIHPDDVVRSQLFNMKFKKYDLANRLFLYKSHKRKIPLYNPHPNVLNNFIVQLRNMFILFNVYLSSKKNFTKYFIKMPIPLFRLYSGIIKILYEL